MNSNTDWCLNPPYVYDSSSNTTSDFEFTGDDKSDCTLLIHNVQFSYSGVYKFRFITNVTGGKYTGQPGVTLQVAGENPTQWPAVAVVTAVVLFIIFVILGAVIYRRWKNNTLEDKSAKAGAQTQVKQLPQSNEEVSKQEEVTYATVSIKDNNLNKGKRVKAQEENSGKGAEKAKDAENTDDKQPKPQLSSVPQLDVETLHEEEVTYASVCVKDKKLMQGQKSKSFEQYLIRGHFVWSKNNQHLNTSGPVLYFPALTVRDSGNYTCTWKTGETSGSETISLHVEGDVGDAAQWKIWIIVLVTAGVILISLVTGAVIYNRRSVHAEQQKEDDSTIYTNIPQTKSACVSLANVQQQKEDDSTIYANVPQKKGTCVSLA
ncbi:hypothetical protein QTP86_023091, partial [Hemibagrus guttatus]